MNGQMLLQSNWKRVTFTPDINEDPQSWEYFIKSEMQPDLQHYTTEQWSDICFDNETCDLYIFRPHHMLIEQFIEEELSDDFAWTYKITAGTEPLEHQRSSVWSNYHYEDEDNCIITMLDNEVALIAGK